MSKNRWCLYYSLLLLFVAALVFSGAIGSQSAMAQGDVSNEDRECFSLTKSAHLYSTAGVNEWRLEIPVTIVDRSTVGDPKHIFLSIPPQLDGYAAVVNRWHNPGTDTGMVFVLGIHRLLDNSQYEGLHLYIKHTDCKALEVNKLSIAQGQTPPTNQIRIYARVYMGFILLALAIAIGLMISLLSYRFNWFGQRDKLDAVLRFPWISDG